MTTVAFDGQTIAADTMHQDGHGLKDYASKLMIGKNLIVGGAGESHKIGDWWRKVKGMGVSEILDYGYPTYDPDTDNSAIMLVDAVTLKCYKLGASEFAVCGRGFHAIGSGRDFALAAMHMGQSAKKAVEVAMEFDAGTGGEIEVVKLA